MKKIIKQFLLRIKIFGNKSRFHLFVLFYSIYIILGLIFVLTFNIFGNGDIKEKTIEGIDKIYEKSVHISEFNTFYEEKQENIIKAVEPEIDYSNIFQILYFNEEINALEQYKIYKLSDENWNDFELEYNIYKDLIKNGGVGIYHTPESSMTAEKFVGILFPLLMIGLIVVMVLKMSGIGLKSSLTLFSPNKRNKVSFNDIGGIEGNKTEISDLLKSLKNWKKFRKKGIRAIRGVLLYGPPGTGKTMIAKAIATEIKSEIFIASGSDFGSKYINEGSEKVKKSFKEIEKFITKHKKDFAILFIDEIDSILKQRGSNTGHNEDDKVVNSFLDRIDGIEGSKNIIIIGATNYISNIDEAALSRFDKKIPFKLPTKNERLDIISKKFKKISKIDLGINIKENIDFSVFAGNTAQMSGRDIDNVINEVHRVSVLYDKLIDENLIQEVFADFVLGKDNTGVSVNKKDSDIIAYHELGHAIIGHINGKEVHTVTTIPKGPALGITWSIDKEEKILKTKEDLIKQIHELMGGRIAEKLFIGNVTTGASNDYERITQIAFSYFKDYNFEYDGFQLGYVLNGNNNNNKVIDVEIHKKLEGEVKKLIINEEKVAEKILKDNEVIFNLLIDKLLTKRVIFKNDIEKAFNQNN